MSRRPLSIWRGCAKIGWIYAGMGLVGLVFALPTMFRGELPWILWIAVPAVCFPLGFATAFVAWPLRGLPARFGRWGSAVLGAWAITTLLTIGFLISEREVFVWPDVLFIPVLGTLIGAIAAQFHHAKLVLLDPEKPDSSDVFDPPA